MDVPILTSDAVRRLTGTLARSEAEARSHKDTPARRGPALAPQVLKITGAVSAGEYPAKLAWRDAATGIETLSDEVRFRPSNGATPASGDYVNGVFGGLSASGGYGLYVGAPAAGFTGTQTIVTGWNAGTCTATTKTMTVVNGLIQSIT